MSTNEYALLREVHEAARQFLRFKGVDFQKQNDALVRLVDATEAVKDLDGDSETEPKSIDMVLFCPACLEQHIDEPDYCDHVRRSCTDVGCPGPRTNPPHKSHLCRDCGHQWRPADVPTNGVHRTKTHGKDDMVLIDGPAAELRSLRLARELLNPPKLEWPEALAQRHEPTPTDEDRGRLGWSNSGPQRAPPFDSMEEAQMATPVRKLAGGA